jgi:deazaflavin-dependent oxidoreductase (nitroreductase family)
MSSEPKVVDSPTGWVNKHIQDYVETDGANGQVFAGVPALLITTKGRKTGTLHRTALYYGEDNGRYVIVASKGGSPAHPAWFLNLEANPDVELQVGAEHFPARARVAEGEERSRLWKMMAAIFPNYDSYQASTEREIPIVVLERASAS